MDSRVPTIHASRRRRQSPPHRASRPVRAPLAFLRALRHAIARAAGRHARVNPIAVDVNRLRQPVYRAREPHAAFAALDPPFHRVSVDRDRHARVAVAERACEDGRHAPPLARVTDRVLLLVVSSRGT